MYRTALIFTASFIFSGFITGKASLAFDENSSASTKSTVSPADETSQERGALQQLAVALAAGDVRWSSFDSAKIDDEETKRPLDPSIPGMNCSVDEIGDYVSCYGSPMPSKEKAEDRFTGLIDELQAVLPPDRWRGAEIEPRTASIRSYTYQDQDSDAQIDIDIAPQWSPDEEISYVVTIFGWTAIGPRL